MHRLLLRLLSYKRFPILLLIFPALALSAGCGFVYPPPTVPDVVKKEVFHVGDPIALLSFEPGRTGGNIIGALHGWPFPHVEGTEGIPTGTFTYVGQFTVFAKSDEDGMPAGAEGTRKVYFQEKAPQLNFANSRGYQMGQEVALDAISMSFTFKENHRIVAVRMISQQKSARRFAYQGKKIEPPPERDTAETFDGEYSAELGGYVLRTISE